MFSSIQSLCIIILLYTTLCSAKPKYIFVSSKTCDRYSLDALYHEKYKIITEAVLTDSTIFAKNVLKKVEDSLQQVMIQIPGHDKSSREEMIMHQTMTNLNDMFAMKVKKAHNNITSQWNSFIEINHSFLGSNDSITFNKVMKCMEDVYDSYSAARKTLDEQTQQVVSSVKIIVHNGLLSIKQIMDSGNHHSHQHENASDSGNETEEENLKNSGNKTEEEKMKEIIKDIIPSFLQKVTETILERKVNLSIPVTKTADNRDSVLDDLCFAASMMKGKVKALEPEVHTEEYVDLARRNLYILWADKVNSVYKDKISEKSKTSSTKRSSTEKFEEFWSNEEELANTLVSLMEVYP